MKTRFAVITVKENSIIVETEQGINYGSRKSFNAFVTLFKTSGLEQLDFWFDGEGHYVFGVR